MNAIEACAEWRPKWPEAVDEEMNRLRLQAEAAFEAAQEEARKRHECILEGQRAMQPLKTSVLQRQPIGPRMTQARHHFGKTPRGREADSSRLKQTPRGREADSSRLKQTQRGKEKNVVFIRLWKRKSWNQRKS